MAKNGKGRKESSSVVFGPLTFDLNPVAREGGLVQYAVRISQDGDEQPFLMPFAAPAAASLELVAKSILNDFCIASKSPERQWQRLVDEMDKVSMAVGIPTPEDIVMMVRHYFERMAAWVSERGEAVRSASQAADVECA